MPVRMSLRLPVLAALLGLAGLLGLTGCLAPMADTGPNPGRLNLHVKAMVGDDLVRQAVRNDPLQPVGRATASGMLGPNWHLDAYLVDAQGQEQRLPLAQDSSANLPAGNAVNQRVGYLLPPGQQTVRLVLQAEVTHFWQEQPAPDLPVLNRQGQATSYDQPNWRQRSSVVPVQEWKRELRLNLAPGQAHDLTWP